LHSRSDDLVGAGSGPTRRRTRLERYVQHGAFRDWLLEISEAFDFRVREPRAFVVALGHDLPIYHQNRSDCGIGACLSRAFSRLGQSCVHERLVLQANSHTQRYLAYRPQANRLRIIRMWNELEEGINVSLEAPILLPNMRQYVTHVSRAACQPLFINN